MRTIIKNILFYSVALYITSGLFSQGLKVSGGLQTIFTGGFVLALMSFIIKPILKIISFPINLLTLGLFGFVIDAIILYLLTRFVTQISVSAFVLQSYSLKYITTPRLDLNGVLTFIFLSFMLSFIVTVLTWITKA